MTNTGPAQRIAVIGAGGVGGLLSALLARAGHDVRLLARGAALTAIAAHGVIIRGPDGEHTVPLAKVTDDPSTLGPVDLILVTVKTWQLADLGPRLIPLLAPHTLVLPMQNGVEASEILATSLGDAHVLGAVCRVISWIERPGELRWIGQPPSLTIGARVPTQAPALDPCAATLRSAGMEVLVSTAIDRARWLKFIFISAYSAVGAVARVPLGTLRADPTVRTRLESVMREIAAVAAARGVTLPPDTIATTMQRIDILPTDATASMHRDIVEGRPSELHELIGAAVRLGREANVPTPVSAALYAELEPLERLARAR